MDIRCSRDGTKCNGCPIMKECEKVELTEEVNLWEIYDKALNDFAEQFKAHCNKFTTKVITDKDIDFIRRSLR